MAAKTVTSKEHIAVDLSTPLSMGSSFRFPSQSRESRREMLWGAALLVLLPGVGWLLNMGRPPTEGPEGLRGASTKSQTLASGEDQGGDRGHAGHPNSKADSPFRSGQMKG